MKKVFNTTQSDLRKYNGEIVEVGDELTDEERDPEVGRMWRITFSDGSWTDAFEDELSDLPEGENDMNKKYYYDFGYFFSRKESGSCRVTLDVDLGDSDIDVDEAISVALKAGELDEEYADNIVYVTKLSEQEAKEMGFEI